jgi:hypothetical protein
VARSLQSWKFTIPANLVFLAALMGANLLLASGAHLGGRLVHEFGVKSALAPEGEAAAIEAKKETPAAATESETPAADAEKEAPVAEPKVEAPAAEAEKEASAAEPKPEAPAPEPAKDGAAEKAKEL